MYSNDPSCNSVDEVIDASLPFYAIFSYRIANNVYKEKLLSEGFELTPSTKSLCKIKDFKKYLFDYDLETNVDSSLIEFVNKRGITTLASLDINK